MSTHTACPQLHVHSLALHAAPAYQQPHHQEQQQPSPQPACVCCPTQVTVQRATGLPAADITGRSDPYVVLSMGDSSASTRVINQELNPVWNETHILYVK